LNNTSPPIVAKKESWGGLNSPRTLSRAKMRAASVSVSASESVRLSWLTLSGVLFR
jgi:hypothetical protein